MHKNIIVLFLLLVTAVSQAQPNLPEKPNSAEIYHKIEKLNFLGSALYIAAHPDDENTRLISFLSNHEKARTGYLSLTRGDGGQNLIGLELRELLGVIRTQELIEARKVDGGEQFFSRANDFGYSKVPNETLQIWDKEDVLEDMVWIIRKFQPDVIVTRFDHRSPGTTHGHHTSSAMLTQEAFYLANDDKYATEQLKYTTTWQPERVLFNTSWWFFGGRENFEKADKSKYINLSTGFYYPLLGQSNQEIAALSRSKHKSQGFGTSGARGEDMEYLELTKGSDIDDKQNLFEGIDTSWNRVKDGKPIGEAVSKIIKEYDFANPAKSVPALVKVYQQISKLKDNHWKELKLKELKAIIADCSGLYLEAYAETQSVTPGDNVTLHWEAINRSNAAINLNSITVLPLNKVIQQELALEYNIDKDDIATVQIPDNTEYTSPYWLEEKAGTGMYVVNDLQKIGIPDIIRNFKVAFSVNIEGVTIPFERTIVHKFSDPVKGEVYQPFDIIPAVSTEIMNDVQLFKDESTQVVLVKVKAGKDNCNGIVKLDLPKEWSISPATIPFDIANKDEEIVVNFEVTPPSKPSEVTAKSVAVIGNNVYDKKQVIIDYPHIAKQQALLPAIAKFTKVDLEIKNSKIAYIMGAGDNIPKSLEQMGYEVALLTPESLSAETLEGFDVVITGIRAYNVLENLAQKQDVLFNFVENGGNMVVQYNTTGHLSIRDLAPYELRISRDRVTEEDAKVTFLNKKHPVLNAPNKITENDFKGWVQEQGLYFPDKWGDEFEPILSSHDTGETPKNGSLLIARYGKGYYIYTGLSFFRELPQGVSGAYRLMANIIDLGKK